MYETPDFDLLYKESLNGGAPIEEDGALELTVDLRAEERTQPARENW